MATYAEVYKSWQDDPEAFWMEQAKAIDWIQPPSKALDDSNPPFYRWFAGGEVQHLLQRVDRHVERARRRRMAIIYDSPGNRHPRRSITYRELHRARVAKLGRRAPPAASAKGDRVIVYMPMIPEAVDRDAGLRAHRRDPLGGVRRLRRERAGVRIDDAKPKVILSASCGIEPGRVVPTSRCWTRPSSWPRTSPTGHLRHLQRPQARPS